MFVLTKEGYKDLTKYNNYRFSCIGADKINPHIFVKFEESICYEITFLNGENVVIGDKLKLLCVDNYEEKWIDVDAIKFGIHVVIHKTPQEIIFRNKRIILPLIKDLIYKIENIGITRDISTDATYVDMIESWKDKDLKEYVFSLYNIGIYVHIKKCINPQNKFIMTLNSEALNYIFSIEESKEIIENMDCNSKIYKLKNKINIDRERDFVKIIKKVQKVKKAFLCKKVKNNHTEDSWESIVIEGILVKNV